jgi:hypothetical protein
MTAAEACLKLVEELPGKGADNLRAAIHSEWRSAPLSMRGYLGYNPERVVWNSESGGYGAETIVGCGARSALGAGPQRPEKNDFRGLRDDRDFPRACWKTRTSPGVTV